jgi:hypothetical protein
MDSGRLASRILLLDHMEPLGHRKVTTGIEELHVQRAKAVGLISSDQAIEVFDLSRETDSIRERDGRHSWGGQSHLLARRRVKARSRCVTAVNGQRWVPGSICPSRMVQRGENIDSLRY